MSARDRPRDKQPETESPAATRVFTAGPEWLKYPRQDVLRDFTTVMYFDNHLLVVSSHPDTDRGARTPVLNGIGGEVRQRLEDSMLVPYAGTIDVAFQHDL